MPLLAGRRWRGKGSSSRAGEGAQLARTRRVRAKQGARAGWDVTRWCVTGWDVTGWDVTGWDVTGWDVAGWDVTGWD